MSILWARFIAWAGKWLALAGGLVLALAAFGAWAFKRGFDHAEAKDAAEAVQQAQAAQDTYQAASEAAGKVRQDADKQATSDPDKRADFDNEF
ncbi:MAG TPA: hypothetical protein VFP92_00830 [Rhodanobacteraceae bacterium]|nr:hypothetical protein [Rhodanobacteraceae bacterium]